MVKPIFFILLQLVGETRNVKNVDQNGQVIVFYLFIYLFIYLFVCFNRSQKRASIKKNKILGNKL